MIVVDTNVIAAFCTQSKGSEIAEQVFLIDREWHAPILWMSEFRNILVLNRRRGLSGPEECAAALGQAFEAVPLERTHDVENYRVLDLAFSSGCTAYDCEFVAIAETLGVPLLTWDKEILKQFPRRAIRPEEYLIQDKK